MLDRPMYEVYRDIQISSEPGSLKAKVAGALATWSVGSSEGGQCIGKAGEVLPMAQTLQLILEDLDSGKLIEIK